MTNLFNSSRKNPNKLLVIHGLNNNESAFGPLTDAFKELGWETHFITLPCHGPKRREARNFKEAFACFDRNIRELVNSPYAVIAFSQGALYFQLWLEKRPDKRPMAQVLLAPALFIHRHRLIERLSKFLPAPLPIISFSPRKIRRYSSLNVSEYRILLEGLSAYQKLSPNFKLPTLILIDPKDELVDAATVKLRLEGVHEAKIEMFPRNYLKRGWGRHHILIHPDFFTADDWEVLISKLDKFLKLPL